MRLKIPEFNYDKVRNRLETKIVESSFKWNFSCIFNLNLFITKFVHLLFILIISIRGFFRYLMFNF